jgi:hypothetical protein
VSESFDLQRFVDAQAGSIAGRRGTVARTKAGTLDVVHLSADRRSRLQRDGATLRDQLARRSRRLPGA